jgi:hypothetical protein
MTDCGEQPRCCEGNEGDDDEAGRHRQRLAYVVGDMGGLRGKRRRSRYAGSDGERRQRERLR